MVRAAFGDMTAFGTRGVEGPQGFERWRSGLSWICICVFGLSFAGLLGLSATAYWSPDNGWITFLDRAWRVSGLTGLILWVIPYLFRARRWVEEALSGKT
jgi:hypothetical protein